eukprot:2069209-Pyramimonas_sp.AAC.2
MLAQRLRRGWSCCAVLAAAREGSNPTTAQTCDRGSLRLRSPRLVGSVGTVASLPLIIIRVLICYRVYVAATVRRLAALPLVDELCVEKGRW